MENQNTNKSYSKDRPINNSYRPRYNKPTDNKEDRPRNKTITFNFFEYGMTAGLIEYNFDEALAILANLNDCDVFSSISIPVYMYRNDTSDDKSRKGNIITGYIKNIDFDNATITCVIYANYINYVEALVNPVAFIRGFVIDKHVKNIMGIDICSFSRYEYIAKKFENKENM